MRQKSVPCQKHVALRVSTILFPRSTIELVSALDSRQERGRGNMICFRPTESATARIFPLFPAYVCVYLRVAESICSLFFLFPYSGKLWGSIHSTFRIFLPPPSRPQFNQPCDARFASPRIIKPDDIFRPTTSVSPPQFPFPCSSQMRPAAR